jgi:hypothetical protein
MKNIRPFALLLFAFAISSPALAQLRNSDELKTVTLYSPIYARLRHEKPRLQLCLDYGLDHPLLVFARREIVCYGFMYAGDDLDWLQVRGPEGTRTVIKDLGRHGWKDSFKVAALAPLPKLKPGESRRVTIDTSGKDGADGRPGAAGTDGTDGNYGPSAAAHTSARQTLREWDEQIWPDLTIPLTTVNNPQPRKKPKNPPILVKAALDHIYEIHVVNEKEDYYVLLRVDALTRGDNCTVSWKRVPTPQ